LWWLTNSAAENHDFMVGTVVVTGGFDDEGATIGLTDDQIGWLDDLIGG
jgi:hypothetical protein